jgi:hypothetical protein
MGWTTTDLLALGMALVLLAGAAGKLRDRADFALAVEAYELVPERLVPAAALTFALLELTSGLLLAAPWTRMAGAALALLVMALATAAVIVNLARGRRVLDCGCGGLSGRQPISWWLVLRNTMLALVLLAVLALPGLSLDLAGVLCGGLGFALLYASVDQLLVNGLRQSGLRRPA